MQDLIERFAIFPLPLVLLPGEILPLHIFEPHYKQMIDECLEEGYQFGVLWLSDDRLAETGCTAEISEVLDRAADGRMNIVVQGERPFRLLRRRDDLPWPAGDVELLANDDAAAEEHSEAVRLAYADVVEKATDKRPEPRDLRVIDAYGMAATIELEPALKQRLLELRSEEDRLDVVEELFAAALERFEQADHLAELARTNGAGRP